MSEELKPCPFCGGKAIIMQHWEDFKTNRLNDAPFLVGHSGNYPKPHLAQRAKGERKRGRYILGGRVRKRLDRYD